MIKVRYFITSFVFCVFVLVCTLFTNLRAFGAADAMDFLRDVTKQIKENYIKEVDEKVLINGALEGMLPALDPHSAYLDPQNYRAMRNIARGEFGGIGVELFLERGMLKVISPYENGPAFRAGIKVNDVIVGVNGQDISEMEGGMFQALQELRGPVGRAVTLKVAREDGQLLDFRMVREIMNIQSVHVKSLANGTVAYMKIKHFNGKTASAVQTEFANLRRQSSNLRGLILDLRWNPGGVLDQAVGVTDLFLSDKDIVFVRGRDKEAQITYHANEGDISNGMPIVVLINTGTASAGEIVAGALQDNKRAIILGMKSFGKGSVQRLIPLSNGGALKLTTDLYYTPGGRTIQAHGVVPDIVVEEAIVTSIKEREWLSEDKLKGHIIPKSGETALSASPHRDNFQKGVDGGDSKNIKVRNGGITDDKKYELNKVAGNEQKDFQLMRAIDTLNGMNLYKSLEIHAG
jgi:carboxyl-terminal processing protease